MLKAFLFIAVFFPSVALAIPVTVVEGPTDAFGLSGTLDAATLDNHSGSFYLDTGNHTGQVDFTLAQTDGVIFRTYTTAGVFLQWTGVTEATAVGNVFVNTSTDTAILGFGAGGHLDHVIDGSLLACPDVEITIALFADDAEAGRVDRRIGGAPTTTPSFINFSTTSSFTDFTSVRFLQVAESDYFIYGENAGTPGGHFTIFFEGVDFPGKIRCWECGYDGSANHDYEIRAKNKTTKLWVDLRENTPDADESDFAHVAFSDASNLYYREFNLPENYLDFVDNGLVEINFFHPQDGTTAHRFRIDKLELVERFSYTSIAFLTAGDFPDGTVFDLRLATNVAGEEIGVKSLRLHGVRTSN